MDINFSCVRELNFKCVLKNRLRKIEKDYWIFVYILILCVYVC